MHFAMEKSACGSVTKVRSALEARLGTDFTATTPALGSDPARYPPYHQLPIANSNASPRVRTLKRNTLVGPQLHQGGAKRFQVSAARALWLLRYPIRNDWSGGQ